MFYLVSTFQFWYHEIVPHDLPKSECPRQIPDHSLRGLYMLPLCEFCRVYFFFRRYQWPEIVNLWSKTASIPQMSWVLRRMRYASLTNLQLSPINSRLTRIVLADFRSKSTCTQIARKHHESTNWGRQFWSFSSSTDLGRGWSTKSRRRKAHLRQRPTYQFQPTHNLWRNGSTQGSSWQKPCKLHMLPQTLLLAS